MRIPVAPEYANALGYTVYCFCYLEWGAIYLAETLKPGHIHKVRKRTAGQIAEKLSKLVRKPSSASPELLKRMEKFASDFEDLVGLRNKLVHAHPISAKNKEQRLKYWEQPDWTIEKIEEAAKAFEIASVEAGALRQALHSRK